MYQVGFNRVYGIVALAFNIGSLNMGKSYGDLLVIFKSSKIHT